MLGVPEVILIVLLLVVPIGCIGNWLACFKGWSRGQPCVSNDFRTNVPWGLIDLFVIIVLLALISGAGVSAVCMREGIDLTAELETLAPDELATVFLTFATSTLIVTVLSLAWLSLRFGWHRSLGFSCRSLGADIELGIRWFMMLIVPVVLMQLVLTRWFPTKHPIVEMLKQAGDPEYLMIAAYAAVVCAPVSEEVFFRLFVQGWLEKLETTMQRSSLGLAGEADRSAVIFGGESSASMIPETTEPAVTEATELGAAPQVAVDDSANPYRFGPLCENSSSLAELANPQVAKRPTLWIPILVSSGLFSLVHFRHGPDWIPLFFLALGLGFLYQRTRRIQACIVVHILVNTLGVLQLWSAIRQASL